MDALCEANGTFTLRLLKALCEHRPSENVIFSPVSLSSVLAMVLLGAKGDTAAQMAQVSQERGLFPVSCPLARCILPSPGLPVGGCETDFHQDFQQLLVELNKTDTQYLLRTANRIFGEKTYEFLSTFKESCLRFYYAELEQLSFAEAAEPSRKHINAWISKKTEGKIPELLSADSINAETKLVLVNAVYFRGRWSEEFDKAYTREMPFRVNQKEQRPVQMMFQDSEFRLAHIKEAQAKVLELPYAGEELSMLVLLPDDHVPLSSVEKHLTWEKFLAWTHPDSMKKTQVSVFLPKFKLGKTYNMRSVLSGLRVAEAFQPGRADFSGMSHGKGLCLSTLAHRSVVEVNEEGTEAAAASAAIEVDCGLDQPRFCADHPFLFFIRHN
ncbi:Serpin B9, partial [Bos mutus]